MSAQIEVIGVRHHSPACAGLVRARMQALRPDCVLIEGPSDFNPRIAELQNPAHRAPIAIFSYCGSATHTQHVFVPFAECSPEWVALQEAAALGAITRLIDLPYWHPGSRGQAELQGEALARARQHTRELALAQRFGMDGVDALWDHLFEQAMPTDELQVRLATYFDELRTDEPGDSSDFAREAYMARWIAHAAASAQRVLVVCGGWHRRPLLQALAAVADVSEAELELSVPTNIERYGNFLIPYSERQLEALSGYAAGMQSPAYYTRLFRDGAVAAAEWAISAVVQRWRAARQPLSTAALIAAHARIELLARLRGHPQPMRIDVLDGLLDAISQDALSAPPPWTQRGALSMQDDPALREVLLALTGEAKGQLAPGTPLPPLLAEVEALLDAQQLKGTQALQLDRRLPAQDLRAQTLWRLRLLRIPGFDYQGSSAPGAARQQGADQQPLEQWQLQAVEARHTALIEAGAYGPTLEAAALRCLSEQISDSRSVDAIAELYVNAVRAGYHAFGAGLLPDLQSALHSCGDHGLLGRAGLRLLALHAVGLGQTGHGRLLEPALQALLARLLWLLEGLSGPTQPAQTGDVDALNLIDRLCADAHDDSFDISSALAVVTRVAAHPEAPPSLRGACFAVLWRQAEPATAEPALLVAARGFAHGEQLGDFLFGLFALARNECARSQALLALLDAAIGSMSDHEFLLAAPALRQAFHYFPPRERAQIAAHIGRLHGGAAAGSSDWMRLPCSLHDLQRSARLQQAVAQLQTRFGL
ncbi:DUF5682 family protein [Aquimonas sp.]|jgi:hypothetical protein|uniref:DUF5682 family protein n=1 Tax=Aquimonas sp. TaxID=1872588 RepID=UPI0037BE8259